MRQTWDIPDAYLPAAGERPPYGHEAVCILNASSRDAHIQLDLYFEDRPPIKGIELTVGAERARHVRMDEPAGLGGVIVPRETPYAIRVTSDVQVSVQYSRLDVTQPNYSLMTTVAHRKPA
jgi:hypothetical protein